MLTWSISRTDVHNASVVGACHISHGGVLFDMVHSLFVFIVVIKRMSVCVKTS